MKIAVFSAKPYYFEEIEMSTNLRSGAVGFAFGIAVMAVAAQAAQPSQHEHQGAPSAAPEQHEHQAAPSAQGGKDEMHKMMADPAKHKAMMERMAQCRDMMSMMMDHMKHEAMKKDAPTPK
jgi:hypothetical protein